MKIKIKKPKIKIKAPKSISKALSSASSAVKNVGKGIEKTVGSVAKGDVKGIGKGALGVVQGAKDLGKAGALASIGSATGAVSGLAGAAGLKDVSKAVGNVDTEASKGVGTYGDVAADIGANVATGGTYGLAKQGVQSLAGDGLKGLLSGKGLQEAALGAASSYAGVDPKLAKMGLSALTGDAKSAALQGLGSFGGIDPKMLGAASSLIGGDATGAALGLAGSKAGLTGTQMDIAKDVVSGKSPEEIATQQLSKKARGIASDKAGAYAKDVGLDQMIDFGKIKKDAKVISKIPGGIPADIYNKARSNVTDKFLKDASGKTIMGPNNAPIKNPNFSSSEYDKLQEYKEDAATYIPGQQLGEEKWTMDRVLGNIKKEGGKAFEQIKGGAKAAGGAIGGALSSAKEFAAENKGALGLAADAAAAYGGYQAGQEAFGKVEDLSKQQLRDLQAQGKTFEGISYDPERYKQQREFLQQRIAGGGLTAEERQLQQQGDIRAARAAAAERASGIERQARMGAGATGAGSSLAAALSGAQSGANIQSQTNLEREARASQRLEQDIERAGKLSTQQTAEEAELARQQGEFGLGKTRSVGGVRGELGNLAIGRAEALQNLYGRGADIAKAGLSSLQPSQQPTTQIQQQTSPQQQIPQQTPPPQAKVDGAKRLSQGNVPTTTQPTQQTSKPAITQFNQTYTGPMARPEPPQNPMQKMTSTIGGFVDQAKANPQQAVQTVKKKVEEVKKNPLKAAAKFF